MIDAISYDTERLIAGPLTFAVGAFGLLINISAAFCLLRIFRRSQCFALYCLAHLCSDSLVLLVFLLYVAPKTLFPVLWKSLTNGYEEELGYLALAFQYCSFYTTMLITLNRAYVVIFPFKNTAFVRLRFAICATVSVWIFALASSLVLVIPGCSFIFRSSILSWQYEDTDCGQRISQYIDLMFNCAFFFVLIAIDIFTVIYSHYRNKHVLRLEFGVHNTEIARRRRQEIGFFIQSCVVSAGFVWMLCCYHIFMYFSDSKLWSFSQTTLIWELSHCAQGLVIPVLQPAETSTTHHSTEQHRNHQYRTHF